MTEELYQIPDGWDWATVQDVVVDAQPGFASGKKNVPSGIKHLRMNNISKACTLDISSVITVPKDLAKPTYILKPGDVLLCHTNSLKLVGKTALFDRNDGPYAFSNHLTRLRLPSLGPPPEWLWFWLATLWRQRYFETRCKQWVNQATVERDTLLSAPLPIAPLAEQKRIISHIMELRKLNQAAKVRLHKVSSLIKQFRQSVLAKAFRGELTERDPNNEPAEKLIERIAQEHRTKGEERRENPNQDEYSEGLESLPRLPDGWLWTRIGAIGDVVTGKTPSTSNKRFYGDAIPFVKPGDLDVKGLVVSSEQSLSREGAQQVRSILSHSVMVTSIGATIGKTGISGVPVTTNQQINSIVLPSLIDPFFVYYYCLSDFFRSQIRANASSTTIPIINKTRFTQLVIPLAPVLEQRAISAKVKAAFTRADEVEEAVRASEKLTGDIEEAILSKAFRGELVAQDPSDEPASVLLERIRAQHSQTSRRGRSQTVLEIASPARITPKA